MAAPLPTLSCQHIPTLLLSPIFRSFKKTSRTRTTNPRNSYLGGKIIKYNFTSKETESRVGNLNIATSTPFSGDTVQQDYPLCFLS